MWLIFKQEIQNYCRSADIDLFEKCLTIVSTCNLVYRTNYLEENTIAIIYNYVIAIFTR
jgi:hypothetical protein